MTQEIASGVEAKIMAQKKPFQTPKLTVYGTVAHLTQGTATVGQDGTNTRLNMQSDASTKECIVQVGVHPLGFGIYLFDYKAEHREACGHGRQFGVMADEVERVLPDAVSLNSNGFKQVDYAKLGMARP